MLFRWRLGHDSSTGAAAGSLLPQFLLRECHSALISIRGRNFRVQGIGLTRDAEQMLWKVVKELNRFVGLIDPVKQVHQLDADT